MKPSESENKTVPAVKVSAPAAEKNPAERPVSTSVSLCLDNSYMRNASRERKEGKPFLARADTLKLPRSRSPSPVPLDRSDSRLPSVEMILRDEKLTQDIVAHSDPAQLSPEIREAAK
eukprot:GHVU01107455.1.p2 GENE.GHVU01107455.1~~GHVU01107455.1.p2  ORF type:complete len:118 (+),score=11.73 GHVU01107455.1:574-927(+)